MGLLPPEDRVRKILAAVALCASVVSAEPKVYVTPAFGGVAREGAWTAVRVEIDNPDAEAHFEIRIKADGATSFRDVVIPAGSRHGYWMPVRAAFRMPCIVSRGSTKLLEQEIRLTAVSGGERLFLAVSEAPLGLPEHELWKTVLAAPGELPDFSDAYSMFDAVLVRFPNAVLTAEAAEAIRRWTLDGGVLAVCAGIGALDAKTSRLGSVLPVEITGTKEVKSLADIGSGIAALTESFPVADAVARGHADRVPFGASGSAGMGRVLFLGFDPLMRPVADWAGLARFWKIQLPLRGSSTADTEPPSGGESARRTWYGAARVEGRKAIEDFNTGETERFKRAGRLALSGKTVALGWFFALLVAYLVVIGPVDYFVLKALRRQAWTWVTLPLAIVAFCGAAWGMSARTRARDSHIVAVGTIDVFPDAIRENAIYLVVAPLSGDQEITTGSTEARLWPVARPERGFTRGGDPEPVLPEIAWGPRPAARLLPVRGWDPYAVAASSDLPPGSFSVRMQDGRYVVQAPATLRRCRLETAAENRDLGDLEPGTEVPQYKGPEMAFAPESFEMAAMKWFHEDVENARDGLLRGARGSAEHPMITGWIERPAASPRIGEDPPARALFLVRFHLENVR
jgi:hypothetical protein